MYIYIYTDKAALRAIGSLGVVFGDFRGVETSVWFERLAGEVGVESPCLLASLFVSILESIFASIFASIFVYFVYLCVSSCVYLCVSIFVCLLVSLFVSLFLCLFLSISVSSLCLPDRARQRDSLLSASD